MIAVNIAVRRGVTILAVLVLVLLVGESQGILAGDERDARWPQFRGPSGGIGLGDSYPEDWDASRNVLWVRDIPGQGWSSPVIWGSRIFVTSAISENPFKQPSPGIYGNDYIKELTDQGLPPDQVMQKVRDRDNEIPDEVPQPLRWMVYALDAATGEIIWERQAHQGAPYGGRHRKNTYASETPVTDGERVCAYFGNIGVYCYSIDGELLWSRAWEPHPIYLDFGTASSPVIHENLLLILDDNQEKSSLTALDKRTGEQVWRTERANQHELIRSGFSTPFIWENSRRTEIVTLAPTQVISYSLTGEEMWRFKGTSVVAAPTPVAGQDMLFVGSGSPSENERLLLAIRPGATGDISLGPGQDSNQFVVWSRERAGSYITSPLYLDGIVYVLYDQGFFAAFDAKDGNQLYKVRLDGGGHTFSSSPWAAGGKIFCLSEGGVTLVLEPGGEHRLLTKNDLGEMSLASPAAAHDSFYIRTMSKLYRVGLKR